MFRGVVYKTPLTNNLKRGNPYLELSFLYDTYNVLGVFK